MKIVLLAYLNGFGGAERQIVLLANALAERGHDITLASISVNKNQYELNHKVHYVYIPDQESGPLRIVIRYKNIYRLLMKLRPDVTVTFWFQPAYLAAWMSRSIRGKLVYSERGDPGDKEYSGMLAFIRKMSLPRMDGFIFQSKAAQSFFGREVQARSEVIPNPVFIKRESFPKIIQRRKVIVTVGRLHEQKNQKLLIESFSIIADEFPDYTLEIYGNGKLKEALQAQIDNAGLHSRVYIKEPSSTIHSVIFNAALFVLCSDYEGMPNVLLEAMALGIPCISTDWRPKGVAKEIIENGVQGLVVDAESVEQLAKGIRYMLNDTARAEKMGKNAERITERMAPDAIYDAWEQYLEKLSRQI